nr:xylulose kinase-1 [Tanacetum cinerariifolium]
MSTIKFAETHNLVAFLEKPAESEGFEQIVDFLNVNPIKYALTVNPTIYTSCIQQFWDSAKVKTVNEDVQIRALVDEKKIIVTEASIRCDLQFQDVEEVPIDTHHTPIVTQPSSSQPQKKKKSRRKQRKESEVPHTEPQTEESVPATSNDPLPGGEDRTQLTDLMNLCTNLQK